MSATGAPDGPHRTRKDERQCRQSVSVTFTPGIDADVSTTPICRATATMREPTFTGQASEIPAGPTTLAARRRPKARAAELGSG